MRSLLDLLQIENEVEIQQRKHNGINVNNMDLKYGPGLIPKIPKSNFFNDSYITVTKQSRYSYMPAHTHSFLELNYQFMGESTQILNGHSYTLKPGQLLLMDQDLIQKYGYMKKDDLLVNILIDTSSIPSSFIATISNDSVLGSFLYNANNPSKNHENFLIYDLNMKIEDKQIWEQLIFYSLTNVHPFKTREFLLGAALSCLPNPIVKNLNIVNESANSISQIINYIDSHYQTINLMTTSQHFGYNQNYLGNKIKSYTGFSFKELLDRKRLLISESLLLDTNLSVDEISNLIGYQSSSSLFRLFSNNLQTTPNNFRKQYKK
jgi:AraC-like DNA-binding protein